jgi:hypothetical protein
MTIRATVSSREIGSRSSLAMTDSTLCAVSMAIAGATIGQLRFHYPYQKTFREAFFMQH